MNVCCIGDGGSVHVQKKLNYLQNEGCDVHLISSRFIDGYNKEIQLHQLEPLFPQKWPFSGFLSSPSWIFQVKKLLNEIDPDVLDGDFIVKNGYLAALSGFRPYLLTVRGSDILLSPRVSFFHLWLIKYALKQSQLIVCNSDTAKASIERLGIDHSKVVLIRNGVDTDLFSPQKSDASVKQNLNAGSYKYAVISIRNLAQLYNVELLIRAMPKILRTVPDTLFIIAGKGPLEGHLHNMAASLGLMGHVRFVGSIPFTDVPKYLASSDVYVSTSLSDSSSNSLLEAMACGTVPVVTDIPANREVIHHGTNGLLVSAHDPDDLAVQVTCLLKNHEMRERLGRNCTELMKQSTYKSQMETLKSYYKVLSNGFKKRESNR